MVRGPSCHGCGEESYPGHKCSTQKQRDRRRRVEAEIDARWEARKARNQRLWSFWQHPLYGLIALTLSLLALKFIW